MNTFPPGMMNGPDAGHARPGCPVGTSCKRSAQAVSGSRAAACWPPAGRGTRDQDSDTAAEDQSESDQRVVWSNWPQYIDINEDDGSFPTIEAFTEETGIEVEYIEDINDNTEFFGRIRPQLSAGQPIDRDLIVLTDWMAGRIIGLGWVQELNKENIPNSTMSSRYCRTPRSTPGGRIRSHGSPASPRSARTWMRWPTSASTIRAR